MREHLRRDQWGRFGVRHAAAEDGQYGYGDGGDEDDTDALEQRVSAVCADHRGSSVPAVLRRCAIRFRHDGRICPSGEYEGRDSRLERALLALYRWVDVRHG